MNTKYLHPNANLMYKRASTPPCPLGILTSADPIGANLPLPTDRTSLEILTRPQHQVSLLSNALA